MAVIGTRDATILLRGGPELGLTQPRYLGDTNGDGLADFVVVPFANLRSPGTLSPPSGPVAILQFGEETLPAAPRLIDGSDSPANGLALRLDGAERLFDREFVALPLGDYDQDGVPDLLLAPGALRTNEVGARGVLSSGVNAEFRLPGGQSPPLTVAPGDITGDGRPDVAFALVTSSFGVAVTSAIAIAAGTGAANPAETVFTSIEVVRTEGGFFPIPKELVALGDVDGDGIADLGVQFSDFSLYVLFGGTHLAEQGTLDVDDLVTRGLAAKVTGDARQVQPWLADQRPFAITAADIDRDGVRDVVIGTGGFLGEAGAAASPSNGVLMVVRGGEALRGQTVSLALDADGVVGDPAQVLAIDYRDLSATALGQALSSGDFNGDGRDDLAFWRGNGFIGVLLDGIDAADISPGGFVDLGAQGVEVIEIQMDGLPLGIDAFRATLFGFSNLSFSLDLSGDLNGDGADDLLIGLPTADITGGSGTVRDGAVVVVLGARDGPIDPRVPIIDDTIVVNTLADTVDRDSTVTSLREAVQAANAAGRPITIELGEGTHVLGTAQPAGLSVTGDVTIVGAGRSASSGTVIEGALAMLPDALFTVEAGASLSLRSLVLTNQQVVVADIDVPAVRLGTIDESTYSSGINEAWSASNPFGTLYVETPTVTFPNITYPNFSQFVQDHQRVDGRGVTVNAGTLRADDVAFQSLGSYSRVLAEASFTTFGVQTQSGAYFYRDDISYALTEGGAIASQGGIVEISNSLFSENGAGLGGAIALTGGRLTVTDTEFASNFSRSRILTSGTSAGEDYEMSKGGKSVIQLYQARASPTLGSPVDGDGALIHNTGGIVELTGTITESGSRDPGIARISTDTVIEGDYMLVADDPGTFILLRDVTVEPTAFASLSAASAFREAPAAAVLAAEVTGPVLVLGEGSFDPGPDPIPTFGTPSIEDGVITVVIAGMTVQLSGDGLTLDAAAFDPENALQSLASLSGLVRRIVVLNADGVELFRLEGLEIQAADIAARLATVGEGTLPNLLDVLGLAVTVRGTEGADLVAGGAANDLLAGGNGDDTYFFAGDFGIDTVDETTTDGLDTLVFVDLGNPEDLVVELSGAFITLVLPAGANRVALRRDATGETGIEQVQFGNAAPVELASLLPAASPAPEILFGQGGGGTPRGTVQAPPAADAVLVAALVARGPATLAGTEYTLVENTGTWNAIKNIALDPATWPAGEGGRLAIANFVDVRADLSAAGAGELDVKVIGAKRGDLLTGGGDDIVEWVFQTNETTWRHDATIETGAGDDMIIATTVGRCELDDQLLADNPDPDNDSFFWNPAYDGALSVAKVRAGSGDDTITAFGQVTLGAHGEAGDDVITGGGGRDLIVGGEGDDVLAGGEGADRFVFADGDGTDGITDFSAAEGDKVVLAGSASLSIAGSSFTFGTTSVTALNGHAWAATDFVFA